MLDPSPWSFDEAREYTKTEREREEKSLAPVHKSPETLARYWASVRFE
jgi:hypothetical protein